MAVFASPTSETHRRGDEQPDLRAGMDLLGITPEERQAHLLRTRDGMNDGEIADLLGCRRETVNRRRAGFRRKIRELQLICTGEQCPTLDRLLDR